MADLGTIGRQWPMFNQRARPPDSVMRYYVGGPNPLSVDVSGSLSGVVMVNGTPQAGVKVVLLYRSSGQQVALTISASDGSYSFPNLDPTDLKAYCVIFLDPQVDPTYNYTLARDHLTAG